MNLNVKVSLLLFMRFLPPMEVIPKEVTFFYTYLFAEYKKSCKGGFFLSTFFPSNIEDSVSAAQVGAKL